MAMLQLTHILYTCKHPATINYCPLVFYTRFPDDMFSLFEMCGHTRAPSHLSPQKTITDCWYL